MFLLFLDSRQKIAGMTEGALDSRQKNAGMTEGVLDSRLRGNDNVGERRENDSLFVMPDVFCRASMFLSSWIPARKMRE